MDETGNLFLQHGDVCEHLKEIQKKLKAATTQDRIQKKRKENLCTPYQRWVALFLFSFTHCKSTTPAVLYLEQTMAKSKWKKNLDKEKSKTLVEDWYLALSDEETLALLQPESAIMKKAQSRASVFFSDYNVSTWIDDMNTKLGVAPRTDQLAQQRFPSELDEDDDINNCRAAAEKQIWWQRRKWAQRFRKTWGFRIGKLQVRDHMVLGELDKKARREIMFVCISLFVQKITVSWGTFSGPQLGLFFGLKTDPMLCIP